MRYYRGPSKSLMTFCGRVIETRKMKRLERRKRLQEDIVSIFALRIVSFVGERTQGQIELREAFAKSIGVTALAQVQVFQCIALQDNWQCRSSMKEGHAMNVQTS